ncbi:nose resistant to fluoxetine protein 6-like [Sitophilus oryzae]|uniref:Nose resistant to fluoxetine protein 6-like n=1 Tax=Sitophilus oryzae TaxID=7048 RepID=A0A6J2YPS9_SITOR|nr:nose resistant to fluoxetine protein 6-like [Sitophilus oryzae]
MNLLNFPFFAILYIVVTNIKCAEKSAIYSENAIKFEAIFSSALNNGNVVEIENFPEIFRNFSLATDSELKVELETSVLSEEERGRQCLRNVTKCIDEDLTYRSTTDKLFSFMSTSLPPFDLSRAPGVSRSCQKDSQKYVEELKKFKMWALKMYDSTAKIPSGILNGNINQLGDFDMCLAALSEDEKIKGQYCLASLEVSVPQSPYLTGLHKLMQSHYHFKSKLEDPGHRVPRFSSINWALCVPSSCTPQDVEQGLKFATADIVNGSELEIRYEVNPEMCQTAEKTSLPLSTQIALVVFGSIIFFELFATFYDSFANGEKNKWVMCFSLKKNLNSITSYKRSQGDIEAVHGIRMLNAILLIAAHKSMALFFIPYVNRTECVEYLARPFTVIGRAASLYTDPFIMISGLLTSYSLIGKLNKDGKLKIAQEYISRLYRIVPTFAALIAFCTFILPWLNSGPMWNMVVTHHSNICKKYWWRNLLFIHNYFGFKDMCLTHTHHLGIDTQLFFTSPFLVYILWKWPVKGSVTLLSLATISTMGRYYVTYTMKLSNYVHFGTSIQQLFETADYMYILPPHRATVYIMGVFMGYLLRKYKHVTFTKAQLRMGNTIALFSFLLSYLGPSFMGNIDYVYNPTHAALYAAVSPILWVGSFCWVIFTTQLGYKGIIGNFFSMPVWTLWTKVSYTVYLTQFPIFFYNVGITRAPHEFGFFTKMINLQEHAWILALSVALSLTFEMPFQNIRSLLLKRSDTIQKNQEKKIL